MSKTLARTAGARVVRRARPAAGPRLAVALGGGPETAQVLAAAHALAAQSGADWLAVHVETPYVLAAEPQRRLDENLTRARELGAEIVVTRDLDVATALLRVARENAATGLIVGRRATRRRFAAFRPALAERVLRAAGPLAVHVVPAHPATLPARRWDFAAEAFSHAGEYLLVAAVIAGITAFGLLLPLVSAVSIGLVYLLAVIILSLAVGRWPVLLAGVLSAVVWEYIFIPPRFAIAIATTEDALLFGTYFVVALVAGQLTARVRAQARNERLREERATALLRLTRVLAEAASFDDAVAAALEQMNSLFGATTFLGFADDARALRAHPAGTYALDAREAAAAANACASGRPAGRFTPAIPDAAGYYVPLRLERGTIGVLGVQVPAGHALALGPRDLIEAFARQLALMVDREELRAASEREKLLAASEKLHRALFDSVSHELRTPLAVIDAALDGLNGADAPARERLAEEVRIAARRLNRLVHNLLDQTRLESGALKPRLDWCSARDLVNAAVENTRDALAGRAIEIAIADDLPPIRADFALTEHALANLLLNAALHTPAGSPVGVSAGIAGGHAFFTVADRGPGFSPALQARLFRKFSRGENARAGGLGLGLVIVRGLIVAQGGDVAVAGRAGGGATVTCRLPHAATAATPDHD